MLPASQCDVNPLVIRNEPARSRPDSGDEDEAVLASLAAVNREHLDPEIRPFECGAHLCTLGCVKRDDTQILCREVLSIMVLLGLNVLVPKSDESVHCLDFIHIHEGGPDQLL